MKRIAVCINTLERPEGLAALLDSLQVGCANREKGRTLVVVADNSSEASSRQTFDAWARRSTIESYFVHEPRRGIPFARNAAVRFALDAHADAVAFVDDDEEVGPGWLTELEKAQERSHSDIVTGPVRAKLPQDTPDFIREGAFFDRIDDVDLRPLAYCATSNTLVNRRVFEAIGEFDERFALNGGDDTHFFLRARSHGFEIANSSAALVIETIPSSRARVGWLIRRAFRDANSLAFAERDVLPWYPWIPRRLLRILGQITIGGTGAVATFAVSRTTSLKLSRLCARGLGGVAGLVGLLYEEYRTVHGR